MKQILNFIRQYFREVDKNVFILCTFFTSILIFLNFSQGLEKWLTRTPLPYSNFTGHYLLFLSAFTIPYIFYLLIKPNKYFKKPLFLLLLVIAPSIFALKVSLDTSIHFSNDILLNRYWNRVVYFPLRLIILVLMLLVIWLRFDKRDSFYGLYLKNFNWRPYLLILIFMIPLIAAASTQHDFLEAYPKLKSVLPLPERYQSMSWFYKLLFEISYGSDFFSIELFFRGFLILGFIKWAGKEAILPMACFYCTIHFGKPLGECISSYLGGILLGIIIYHTKSIFGGLIVHLGIAWLMELGGYIGNSVFRV
jgi:CAAX prenyl protease-like protein